MVTGPQPGRASRLAVSSEGSDVTEPMAATAPPKRESTAAASAWSRVAVRKS